MSRPSAWLIGFVGVASLAGGAVPSQRAHTAADTSTSGSSPVRFSEHLIMGGYGYNYGIGGADLDGDGDIDLTSADASPANNLYWFENDGTGSFQRHFITRDEPQRLERHMIGDIDRDGLPDVVIVENFYGDLKWYKNPGRTQAESTWKRRYISKGGLVGAYDVDLADFNGDGRLDAVASTWRLGNSFVWFENPGPVGAEKEWRASEVDRLPEDTRAARAADFDGDGRQDFLGTSAAARIVLWYQNLRQGGAVAWKRHVVDLTRGVQPVHGQAVDMDRDGDPDIVMALGGFGTDTGGGVVWYENRGLQDGRLLWAPHVVSEDLPRGFEAVAGDLDGDGDLDIAATGFGSGLVAWFENPGNPEGRWSRYLLKKGWPNANQVILADLNRDGRLDIAAIAERGSLEFRWWKNEGRSPGR